MNTLPQEPAQSIILTGIISVLLLLFLFSFTSSPPLLHLLGLTKVNDTSFFISRLLNWMCLAFIWFYSVKIEKQPLLIWKEKKHTLLTYLLSVITILLIIFIGGIVIIKLLSFISPVTKSDKLAEIINILRDNKLLLIFTSLTAGVVEELIFRGYMLPRLTAIFKSPAFGIIVSSLLFGLLHYKYGTVVNIVMPVFIGLVFAYYYWKYRNITVLILCHFLWDLVSLFLSIKAH